MLTAIDFCQELISEVGLRGVQPHLIQFFGQQFAVKVNIGTVSETENNNNIEKEFRNTKVRLLTKSLKHFPY